MESILRTWLKYHVGIDVDFSVIDHEVKDGIAFIKILRRYDAIDFASVKNVHPSDDKTVCKNNLTQLKIWFQMIDIDFTDDVIDEIISGNFSVCNDILYRLFAVFEEPGLRLITKQKERCVKALHGERFKVSRVSCSDKQTCGSTFMYNHGDLMAKNKNLVKWYKDKHKTKQKTPRLCFSNVSASASQLSVKQNSNKAIPSCVKPYQNKPQPFKSFGKMDEYGYDNKNKNDVINDMCHKLNKSYKNSSPATSAINGSSENDGSCSVCTIGKNAHCCMVNKFLSVDNIQCSLISRTQICKHGLPLSIQQYLNELKSGSGFVCVKPAVRIADSFVEDAWSYMFNYEKNDLKNLFACRLFKQSAYEKSLTAKLKSIKDQCELQRKSFMAAVNRKVKARKSTVSLNVSETSYCDRFSIPKSANYSYSDDENSDVDYSKLNNENDQPPFWDSNKRRYVYDDYDAYCIAEKKRTVELHRKLYAVKLKLRFERHYGICLQALEDMIEVAMKRSEFKSKYGIDVPYYIWNDWKCLFNHEQKINDIVRNVTNLISPVEPIELDVDADKTMQDILTEDSLVACLGTKVGLGFLFSNHISDVPDEDIKKHNSPVSYKNQILLGYVVHRVLESKYPSTPHSTPANIPKFSINAIVNGINDVESIIMLKQLLSKFKVLVIDVNTAVNFCLDCYKQQIDTDELNGVVNDGETEFYSYFSNEGDDFEDMPFKTNFTETTSSLFDTNDSSVYENAARLGHEIFRVMRSQSEIPISILADIIIQYIKKHGKEIKGWVLMNFPSTLYQASVMEHALLDKKFPFHLDNDTVFSDSSHSKGSGMGVFHNDSILSGFEMEVRNSRIVPNPRKYDGEDVFKTYFTMFITVMKGSTTSRGGITKISESCNDNSESTLLLEQPEKEGVPTLYNFYQEQGIGFDFVYDNLDFNTIKQLAHVILQYYVEDCKLQKLPDDTSYENLIHEFEPSVLLTWYPPKTVSDEMNVFDPAKPQYSSGINVELDQKLSSKNINDESDTWNYANYPIFDNALIALASFWEALEMVYLKKLKELVYLKRKISNNAIPFFAFISDLLNSYLNKDDGRQAIVTQFLNTYNNIHQVSRFDVEMKIELHARVSDLRDQLIKLCEDKRNEIDETREILINQNWAYCDLMLFTNGYINVLQIETDRCLGTLEFLHDYYSTMAGNYSQQPFACLKLSEIEMFKDEESDEISMKFIDHPELVDDELYLSVINRMLNYDEIKNLPSPFSDLLETKAKNVVQGMMKIKSQIENLITHEEVAALKKHKEYMNAKYTEIPVVVAKKKGKKSVVSLADQQMKLEKDKKEDEAKEVLIKHVYEEWKQAVNLEIDRFLFRLQLATKRAKSELFEIEAFLGSKFSEFSRELNDRFSQELMCIDEICFLFQTAIEEKTPINARLIFYQNQFYTIKKPVDNLLSCAKFPAVLEEVALKESFTIKQLKALKERLMLIAPCGLVTREAFIQFIQDTIACSFSQANFKLVPNSWKRLKRDSLDILFQELFGNSVVIEWRDLLVHCLSIPYPVTEDIVDAKLQFLRYDVDCLESVSVEDYMKTTLWFERELPKNPLQALRNILAKEFIFSLFSVDNNTVNYTSLLLAFCRDIDPKVGFCKALSLLLGRCVIVYEEDLYLEKILTDHIDTEFKVVEEIVNEILDDVFYNAISGELTSSSLLIEAEDVPSRLSSFASTRSGSGILTQSMYNEFFRRHLVFNWTSNVPETAVITLLSLIYYILFLPEPTSERNNAFIKIEQHFYKGGGGGGDYIYVPKFLDTFWMELIKNSHKFIALSIENLMEEIFLPQE